MKSVFFIIKGNTSSNSDEILVEVKEGRNHFIGGKFDEGETLVQAGLRESFEEVTGLDRKIIKSSLESWLKTNKNFNILDVDGIPEFEQHFVEIYSDIENIKINPEGEVKAIKITKIEKLLEDPYNNTHAVNAWLYMNYLRIKARGRIPQHWNVYIAKIRSGENPFESNKKSILITGHSGSGKTTLIDKIREYGFSRTLRYVTDLDFYGFRNKDDKWTIPVGVIRALIQAADYVIGGGICNNITEVAKEFDTVIWLNPVLNDKMIENIRLREEERNKRSGHHIGESFDTKIKKLKNGVTDLFFREFESNVKNIIVLNADEAFEYVKPFLGLDK